MNLEERRAWMQAGCPVEEVAAVLEPVEQAVDILERKPEKSLPCRSFHLGVIPGRGVIAARCEDCDEVMEHGEILMVDVGLEKKVAQGDRDAMSGLCWQMNGHGKGGDGNDVGYMLMGKPGPQPWQSIEAWIRELMLHGDLNGGPFGRAKMLNRPPDDFERSGWKFSFDGLPLSKMPTAVEPSEPLRIGPMYEPIPTIDWDALEAIGAKARRESGKSEPEPKRPGLIVKMLNRLGLGDGPR